MMWSKISRKTRRLPTRYESLTHLLLDDVEEFQQLRENLMLRQTAQELKVIAVCKANAGEGSSRVACHLAIAFTNDPRARIVLVDSDLRHPGLHALLQVSQENGLYETLIEGPATTKDRIKKTGLPNLSVITSGSPPDAYSVPPTLSADIFQVLKEQFSVVIVDTPPVLADVSAVGVAAQCDGAILVLQAEQTRWEVAREAQARLQRAGVNLLGVVLNRRRYPIPEFLYKRL
jgi:capsular exopolysaccharide synthesis family protein